jgi:hypothetical protein
MALLSGAVPGSKLGDGGVVVVVVVVPPGDPALSSEQLGRASSTTTHNQPLADQRRKAFIIMSGPLTQGCIHVSDRFIDR